ncbi:hypothetical protein LIER_44018 [Lithospermum erythrorhizon]|uniref:Uncharacterized protein n=1 Tax=Lithospermum erythrorhizon TaxID=34254 RepID=A0AAV3RQ53_LITER
MPPASAVKRLLEPNSAQLERDALRKERESLRTGREEALQSNDRLLFQLTKSQLEAQIMEVNLEGIRTVEGLGELVHGSDAGHELLPRFGEG